MAARRFEKAVPLLYAGSHTNFLFQIGSAEKYVSMPNVKEFSITEKGNIVEEDKKKAG